jgi:secondary thiamine-phosphate synthase enzyme
MSTGRHPHGDGGIVSRQSENVNDHDQIGTSRPFLVTSLRDESIVRTGAIRPPAPEVDMPEFSIRTRKTQEMIDITAQVAEVVRRAGAASGLCAVYVPHATAAIVINENADPNVCQDILDALGRMVPEGAWRHDRIDHNAAAHIKATILGPSETVPVEAGRLRLGTWQSIMLVEFDGPRDRAVIVAVR